MRSMMWIYVAFFLSVPETWSMEPGTNRTTTKNNTTTSQPKVYVFINVTFNLGSEVNLTCSNKTWDEMMYVIWNIHLNNKDCKVAFNTDGREENNCSKGTTLKNTSDSQSLLNIQPLSTDDQGIYKCESVYPGGTENYEFRLSIIVPPQIYSSSLVFSPNKSIVCRAERAKPAATISWSDGRNSSLAESLDPDGFVTVESRRPFASGMDLKNLSCIIKHPLWDKEKIVHVKEDPNQNTSYWWLYTPIGVLTFVLLVGFLIFAQKKLVTLRHCCKSDNSSSKPSPAENAEEVEPYASYIQRVNSIYNSSADFFSSKSPAHASHAHI